METININIGPLTSINNLVYHIAPGLKKVREAYMAGNTPKIELDLSNLEFGNVNISALTSLLCISKRLRDFVGQPISSTIKWNPKLQGFLDDVGFFKLASKFNLYNWIPNGIIGGYKSGQINPNTKILYFGDITKVDSSNLEQIGETKAQLKQRIAPNFLMRCAYLFDGFEPALEEIVGNTALELIVNSLIHAEEIAFVGLQRTAKRITLTVCDTGIGFPKSIAKSYREFKHLTDLSHIEGLLIGSLIQKNIHGLRKAITEILDYKLDSTDDENYGWVTLSSFDAELRWQKSNWGIALEKFDKLDIFNEKPKVEDFIGKPIDQYIEKDRVYKGYWKEYPNFLVGSRITFEIVI